MTESIILNKAGKVCSVPGVHPKALIIIDPEDAKIIVSLPRNLYGLYWPAKSRGNRYSRHDVFAEVDAITTYLNIEGFKPLLERLAKKYWNE